MAVTVQVASKVAGVPQPANLRKWALATLDAEADITLRIVNRAEARRLNRDFRGKDYATNVLTFSYQTKPIAADIVLCAQVVMEEARAQGKTPAAHYAHLTVHGMLHARGFDHEIARDAKRMEAREIAILGKLGFANPYET